MSSTTSFTTEDPAAGTQGKPATTALKAERVRKDNQVDRLIKRFSS